MSDTAEATASALPQRLTMDAAISRLVGSTASEATRAPTSGPEGSGTAAPDLESDTPTVLNTGDEPTQPEEPAGEAPTEDASQLPTADSVAFIGEDGTPVTVEEARKGYLRQSEFTKKTQTIAETAKQYAEREATIAQARDFHIQGLQQVEYLLASQVPPEPDPSLRQTDLVAYLAAKDERNEALVRLATAYQQRQQLDYERAEAQRRQAAEGQAAQATMLAERVASWKDPNVKAKETAAIRGYAKGLEFSDDEVERVLDGRADHRLALILRDAVIGRQVREGGAKGGARPAMSTMPQPTRADARPGSPSSASERDLRAARDNLGSASRHDRFAAAVQILAGSQQAARPR